MQLLLKNLDKNGRSLYLYYPQGEPRTAFKRCAITVLRDQSDEESVLKLLFDTGLAALAEDKQIILAFPNPAPGGWNASLDPSGPDDVAALELMQNELTSPYPLPSMSAPPTANFKSTQDLLNSAAMKSIWHPMNDTKYLIGIGAGADMAFTMAAVKPNFIAAILTVGGDLAPAALKSALGAPIPAYTSGCGSTAAEYLLRANAAELTETSENRTVYRNAVNPLQCVIAEPVSGGLDKALLLRAWNELFKVTRRPNTGTFGDIERRLDPETDYDFEIFLDDTRLGDNGGIGHTWFTHVPTSVKVHPSVKVPLILVSHGASDNPAETAEMSKFHELGEKEGFITVYPWSSNKSTWNSDMREDALDDVAFQKALIEYMIAHYPVDPGRVYLSGFSNGAGQAQTLALVHPELVAAVCHIDSNWPGLRDGPSEVDYTTIRPFVIAMERKKEYDWRVPVWYTYGSREPSYPVYRSSTQQHQYDFWKQYNNITVKPTPGRDNPDPCGCGVPGDKYELLKPSKRHPHHEYDVQRFYTNDPEPKNYYNYVLLRAKGHDIAEMDPALGWEYVRHFRRNPDGSLSEI